MGGGGGGGDGSSNVPDLVSAVRGSPSFSCARSASTPSGTPSPSAIRRTLPQVILIPRFSIWEIQVGCSSDLTESSAWVN